MGSNILLVGLGGGIGSILRYLSQKWVNESYEHNFPLATFLVNVKGQSMVDAFIPENAMLLVDKSIKAKHNDIIVGVINGEFTVKRLLKKGDQIILQPANPKFAPVVVTEEMNFSVWGVVRKIIIDPKKL